MEEGALDRDEVRWLELFDLDCFLGFSWCGDLAVV